MRLIALLAAAMLAVACTGFGGHQANHHDVIILNGLVIDGTGNAGMYTDVAVRDGDITRVGPLRAALAEGRVTADQIIDAKGMVVAPGFIDVHTHADGSLLRNREAANFARDGVTTLITGNCGGNYWPVAEFLSSAEDDGIGVNVATLVGHNTVRRRVIGREDVDPTLEQMEEMKAMVDQAMREGAVGLSTGLIYIPGTYTETEEIIELAKVASAHGGIYVSHMRSEGEGIFSAIDEALRIGREADIPVQISHFKVRANAKFEEDRYPLISDLIGEEIEAGDFVPEASRATLEHVMRAREAGQDVTIDQYPYTASSTSLGVLIPDWVRADGDEKACEILNDPEQREQVRGEIIERYNDRGYDNLDWAQIASCRSDSSINGMTIHEVAVQRMENPTMADEIDLVFDLFCAGGAGMVYHTMSESNVERIMQNPYVMICSDSGVRDFGSGVPHPRGYGSNARVLGHYVRDREAITLPDAIRKMTSLPAQRFALRDRGLLREGMRADIAIFDPNTVIDNATFAEPHQYSTGFLAVLVNGVPVVINDEITGALPGDAIRGEAFWQTSGLTD